MAVKANEDTTIAGIRLDRVFTATGSLSSCVFLFSVSACGSFSVSATCVRLGSMGQSRRVDNPVTAPLRDCPSQNQLGSWAYVVNAWLRFGRRLTLPGRSAAAPRCADRSWRSALGVEAVDS